MLNNPGSGRLRLVWFLVITALLCLLSATAFVSVAYADEGTGTPPPTDSATCTSESNSGQTDPSSPNSESCPSNSSEPTSSEPTSEPAPSTESVCEVGSSEDPSSGDCVPQAEDTPPADSSSSSEEGPDPGSLEDETATEDTVEEPTSSESEQTVEEEDSDSTESNSSDESTTETIEPVEESSDEVESEADTSTEVTDTEAAAVETQSITGATTDVSETPPERDIDGATEDGVSSLTASPEPAPTEVEAEVISTSPDSSAAITTEAPVAVNTSEGATGSVKDAHPESDPFFVRGGDTYTFLPLSGDCAASTDPSLCSISDTPIQAAIADIAANGTPDDSMVNVDGGTYNEIITIDAATSLNVDGLTLQATGINGAPRINGAVLLRDLTSFNILGFILNDPVTVRDSSNVTIEGTVDNDALQVNLEGTVNNLSIDGTEGDDAVTVNTSGITAPSTVDVSDSGIGANDSLTVVGTDGGDTFSVTSSQVQLTDKVAVSHAGVESLSVDGGGGDDGIAVDTTSLVPMAIVVDGKEGDDSVSVQLSGTVVNMTVDVLDSGIDASDSLTILGTPGDDRFDVSAGSVIAGTEAVVFTDVEIVTVDGGGGSDTLAGPDTDSLYEITDANLGTLTDIATGDVLAAFLSIENLVGGDDNQDTFVFTFGGHLDGTIDGGVGGYDSFIYFTALGDRVIVVPDTGGMAIHNGTAIQGLEPVVDTADPNEVVITGTVFADTLVLEDDASLIAGQMQLRCENCLFEFPLAGLLTFFPFMAPSQLISIRMRRGKDRISLGALDPTVSALFSVDGGYGEDTLVGYDAVNTWRITGPDGGMLNNRMSFSSVENVAGGNQGDTFSLEAGGSLSGELDGGEGDDELSGPEADSTWNITGPNAGSIAGISFTEIENLTGGLGADVFVFSGGSVVGLVEGGAGIDTLDYAAYFAAVMIDLSTSSATAVGGFAGIENVIGGSGVDTLIGLDADVTWNVADIDAGSVEGMSFLSVENLTGGSGADTFVLVGGSLSGVIDGGEGNDELYGPDADSTWNITGPEMGSIHGVAFTQIENLTGAADNQDTFVVTGGGILSGLIDGGAGGFDSLIVSGVAYETLEFTAAGPSSGTVRLDDNVLTYTGLEPISVITIPNTGTPPVTAEFNLTALNDEATVTQSGSTISITSTSSIKTFEIVDFTAPTMSLTINGEDGTDTVIISSLDLVSAALTVTAEIINVPGSLTAGDVELNAADSSNGTPTISLGLIDIPLPGDLIGAYFGDPTAIIDLTGANITANAISLNAKATTTINPTPATFGGTIEAAVAYAKPEAEVKIVNATITANSLFVDVDSVVTIAAEDSADSSDTDSETDAGITVVIVDADALAHISGGSTITISGAIDLKADNTINVVSAVDGSSGDAGATLAVALVFTDTRAYIDGSSSVSAGTSDGITLNANTNSSVISSATSTQGGAEQNTSGGNQTEANLQDPNNDGDTSDQASTSDGSIDFAGAVAITYLDVETHAYIASSGAIVAGDDITISASSANRGMATADGTETGSGASGVGVAVTINIAIINTQAYIGGNADLTADNISLDATVGGRKWNFTPSSAVDDVADTIDFGVPHGLPVGYKLVYDNGGGANIGGLTYDETYYVIVDETTPNLLQLAATEEHAKKGVALDLSAPLAINSQSLTEKESGFIAEATSGAGGSSSVGVAGSLAINVATTKTEATIASGADVNVNGANVSLSASAKTKSTANALPKQDTTGKSLGLGASVALNITDNITRAAIEDTAILSGAADLTLSASGTHKMSTQAKAGATGGTAITPVVALSFANNDTLAEIGTHGSPLVITASLNAQSSQETSVSTKAIGAAEGSNAAVGASLALNVVADIALAQTARSITTTGGDITFGATSSSVSKSNAKASAKGGKKKSQRTSSTDPKEPADVDGETSKERSNANTTATNNGARGSSGGASTPTSSTSDGPIVVAAAISVNIAETTTRALIPDNKVINASGALTLSATNNTDGYAVADGSATKGDIGIGAAVAVNYTDVVNEAYIGNATVNVEGVTIEAKKNDEEWTFHPVNDVVDDTDIESLDIGDHDFKTGDMVIYQVNEGDEAIDGLKDGEPYYVIEKDNRVFDPDTTINGDWINLGPNHDLATGDLVTYKKGESNTEIGGLTDGTTYKVEVDLGDPNRFHLKDIATDTVVTLDKTAATGDNHQLELLNPTRIKLAKSAGDAFAGKAIELDKTNATGSEHKLVHMSSLFADATSGAGATDVSVAGSLGLNIVHNHSEAFIKSGASVDADGSDSGTDGGAVSISADNTAVSAATAKSKVTGSADVGVGASVPINIVDDFVTHAEIEDTAGVTHADALTVRATSSSTVATLAEAGSAGDVAISPAVAIAIVSPDTTAKIKTGSALLASGDLEIEASLTASVKTLADAEAGGEDVSVGAAVAVNVFTPTTMATTERNLTATSITIEANSTTTSVAETKAGASGNETSSSGGKNADNEANDKVQNTPASSGSSPDLSSTSSTSATQNVSNSSSTASSESGQESSGVGVAAAVSVNYVDLTNSASIGDGRTVTGSAGAVTVRATHHTDATSKATGTSLKSGASANIGAAVGLNIALITNEAKIGTGATVSGQGVTVEAITASGETNDFIVWGFAASGGDSEVSIAGSVGVNVITLTTTASVGAGAAITSTGNVTISANNAMGLQNLALSGALSTSVGVGASVAVNVLTVNTKAYISNATVNATEQIIVSASSSLVPLDVFASDVPLIGNINVTSVVIGGALSDGDVAVGGSVLVDVFNIDTHAYIASGAQINQTATPGSNQSISITATDSTIVKNGAGGLGGATGSVGIGAGVIVEVINKDVRAYIGKVSTVNADANVAIQSTSFEEILNVAATIGASNTAGISASIIVVVLNNGSRAYIESEFGFSSTVHAGGNMTISASDSADKVQLYAGGLAFGSSAGVGVSTSILVKTTVVRAFVGVDDDPATTGTKEDEITTTAADLEAKGSTGLSVSATQTEDVILVAVAGGGASTAGVAGSVVVNVTKQTTRAYLGNGTTVNGNNAGALAGQSVAVAASDTTTILGIAGALAIGGSAGVGAGIDVEVVTKDTEAWIGSASDITVLGNVTIDATSSEKVTSISVGAGFSGTAAVTVNAGVSVFNITTKAYIGDGVSISDGATVEADGSVRVAADESMKMDIIAGNISGGGSAAVGAAVAVPVVNKETHAWIGDYAQVNAKGGSALTVATGTFTVDTIDTRFDPSSAVQPDGMTINLGYDHGLEEDQQVLYDAGGGTNIAGLIDGERYYVHVDGLGSQEVQLKSAPDGSIITGLSGGSGENHRLVPTNQAGVRQDASPRFNPQTAVSGDTITLPYDLSEVGEDDPVVYSAGGGDPIGGLVDGATYYAHVVSSPNQFQLKAEKGGSIITLDKSEATGRSHSLVEHGNTPSGDASAFGPRQITAGIESGFRGVAVTATNSDDIAAVGVSAGISGTAAVNLAGAVYITTVNTSAHIGVSAEVNCGSTCDTNITGADPGQSVHVAAANQFYHLGISTTLAVALSAGVAIPVAVRVVNLNADAYIDDQATVNALNNVVVSATTNDTIVSVAVGAGGGTVGIAGTVSVTVLNTHTYDLHRHRRENSCK